MVPHQKEVYYRLGIWHLHITHKTNTRLQLLWMVSYHPENGCPPTKGWSPTKRKCTTDMEFGTYTLLTKLTPGDNCHGWSPTISRMVTHHKDVYYRLGIWHLHISHKTNTRWQLDSLLPTLEWSPTRRKYSRALEFGTNTLLTKLAPGDNWHWWSPTIPRRVTC